MTMTFSPIFSVVIPCYKVNDTIESCLESVLAQSFKSFEIICVDDGCPRRSFELIERYQDQRIRIVHQENRGLAAARNTGINASKGIFIALLDGDDLWHPDKLALHFKHLQMRPKVGVSYSASEFIDEAGKPLGVGQHPKLRNITAKDIFCRNPIGNGSAPVLRKSLLQCIARTRSDSAGNKRLEYFDERLRQSEDVELWLRIALKTSYRFEGIEQALTYYRVNMSGLSANLSSQYLSWLYSVKQNRKLAPQFVKHWFPLACAYQKRYLARRAVQSRDPKMAISLMLQALKHHPGILLEEPKRTLLTLACTLLCTLPKPLYSLLERSAMGFASLSSRQPTMAS